MNLADQIKYQFKTGSELTRLIYINLAVFLAMILIKIFGNLIAGPTNTWQESIEVWFAMPSDPLTFLTRPWTLFSYMFLHLSFGHIFSNLILFYFLGTIFLEYLGGRRLVTAYLGGGILGGILYFIMYNIFPVFENGYLLGASAGVWGVVAAIAIYVPNLPVKLFFVLEVKLWQIVISLFFIDLIAFSNFENPGGMIAHFGGALFGYFLVTQLRKGKDWSVTVYAYFDAIARLFKAKPKLRTVHKSETRKTSTAGHSKDEQDRLNEILDKIKISGYDNLSKEEKAFLFKFGNN
jgi:membrane associated rhomboid family serine protease